MEPIKPSVGQEGGGNCTLLILAPSTSGVSSSILKGKGNTSFFFSNINLYMNVLKFIGIGFPAAKS